MTYFLPGLTLFIVSWGCLSLAADLYGSSSSLLERSWVMNVPLLLNVFMKNSKTHSNTNCTIWEKWLSHMSYSIKLHVKDSWHDHKTVVNFARISIFVSIAWAFGQAPLQIFIFLKLVLIKLLNCHFKWNLHIYAWAPVLSSFGSSCYQHFKSI